MAIIEKEYTIGLTQVGNSNLLTNHGILELLESIACYHSDNVNFGINEINDIGFTWMLLHWKVKVFKRVRYGETVTVKTWAGYANKFYTLRDFEIFDKNGELICIASSKWALIDINNRSIAKITEDIIGRYEAESKSVFGENDIPKIKQPEISTIPCFEFKVLRRDIDVNEHMHNIYYLDYALEALPEDIYNSR